MPAEFSSFVSYGDVSAYKYAHAHLDQLKLQVFIAPEAEKNRPRHCLFQISYWSSLTIYNNVKHMIKV